MELKLPIASRLAWGPLVHHITASYCDFWSQKYITGGLNSPDEVTDEMVSETSLFQTACSSVQNKANKCMTEEVWKENVFELEDT